MKNVKRCLSALLALVLLLSAVPAALAVGNGGRSKSGYLHVYAQGVNAELVFVSTHKCLVSMGKYKEYFTFRTENNQVIFTNSYGTDIVVEEEKGEGTVKLPLDIEKWITLNFSAVTLARIKSGDVHPGKKAEPQ
ncbi:MAG: hypothetical protein IJQ62_06060 [Clostridia bacterium]|nr:hypothetical protein [Clostridia bacterium]